MCVTSDHSTVFLRSVLDLDCDIDLLAVFTGELWEDFHARMANASHHLDDLFTHYDIFFFFFFGLLAQMPDMLTLCG
jgi:hypothetical protein